MIASQTTAEVLRQGIESDIRKATLKPLPSNDRALNNKSALTTVPAAVTLEEIRYKPIPEKILGSLFFEGELCILFSDTGNGKSILAVQLADDVTRGVQSMNLEKQIQRQSVLLIDCELSDRQFALRCSNQSYPSHSPNYQYQFEPTFLRACLNADLILPEGKEYEDFLIESIEAEIKQHGVKIIIIDNITYLRTEMEKAKDALPLMKKLKEIKSKYEISILCLAHTPKRDYSKPISRNDLQGSKMLMNFCDSSFAIGESSQDKSLRYIKQIKVRNAEVEYDSNNVLIYRIEKQDNFLGFHYIGTGSEQDHLRIITPQERETRDTEILELKKQGKPNTAIASMFGISETMVRKIVKKYEGFEPGTGIENGANSSTVRNGSNGSNEFDSNKKSDDEPEF